MEDEKLQNAQFDFSGQWVPDLNPLKIGSENFSQLDNYRYVDGGIEVAEGYTEINETALTTYLKARNGIQLRTPYTKTSYVLWQVLNSAGSASRIAVNETAIPDAGDFSGTYAYTPAANAGRWARFSQGIGYANGSEACIWDGEQMRCAAFFKITGAPSGLTLTGPVDYTEAVNNSLTDGNNPTVSKFLIGSTRPLKGFYVTVAVANEDTSTLAVQEFKTTGWTSVGNLVDGTAAEGVTMAQSGAVTFDSTVDTSIQALIEETRLYYYYVALSAGSAGINQVTVNAPFQTIVDIWDGVYRDCIHAQATRSSSHENWTQEVNTESSAEYPIAAKFGGLTSSDSIELCCQERACAARLAFIAGKVNATAATVTVKYWNGSAYATVGTVYDGTAVSGATFAQTGIVSWVTPLEATERQRARYGISGYWYEFTFSATLTDGSSHDGTSVDTITFIPAEKSVFPFAFPFEFQGRAMLCDFSAGQESNRVDYSMKNAPDVWNGEDSSAMGKSLYFGGYEKLVAASSIYNRFGSSIYEIALFLKQNETYLLNGVGPEDFRIFKISKNYGCPAPHTVSTAEVSYSLSEELQRNVCLWLSYKGPILFDGAVIKPIPGIDLYFDTRKDTCINFDAIDKAYGAFDPFWQEWHLFLPVGTSQTTLNTWLVYDLRRQRWYRRVLDNSALCPQSVITVQDESGVSYLYGMTDDGVMMRLNYGTSWNGLTMVHRIKTAAIMPTGSIWDECLVRKFKLLHEVPTFTTSNDSITVNIRYYIDGATNSVSGALAPMTISYSGYLGNDPLELSAGGYLELDTGEYLDLTTLINARLYATYKVSTNMIGNSFIFEFYQNSNDYDFLNNFGQRPIGWGMQFAPIREDENF